MATSEPDRVPILIPQLGLVEFVYLTRWLREHGSSVAEGEPIAVIESEKAETEIGAPVGGTLTHIVAAGSDELAPGTVIGHVTLP